MLLKPITASTALTVISSVEKIRAVEIYKLSRPLMWSTGIIARLADFAIASTEATKQSGCFAAGFGPRVSGLGIESNNANPDIRLSDEDCQASRGSARNDSFSISSLSHSDT